MVPSFSEDFTRVMRGQPKQLSRNYRRRNGRNAIEYVLCTPSQLSFVRLYFRLFVARLAVHNLAVYSVLGSLSTDCKQNLTATATGTMACVIILCSFLCRCLQKVTKQQREITTFCIFERASNSVFEI